MNLYITILVVVTVFLLLLKLLASLIGRASERLLTSYFRDLEALLEQDRLPADWAKQLKQMARQDGIRRYFAHPVPWEEAAKPFLLKKISKLYSYFEGSPFVEDPETRALLLEQLTEIKTRWEEAELSEILAHYKFKIDNMGNPSINANYRDRDLHKD